MARRKLPAAQKKVMINLTLRPDVKQMLFAISDASGKSVSTLVEEYAQKEYLKLRKAQKCADIGIPGQLSLESISTHKNTDNNACSNNQSQQKRGRKSSAVEGRNDSTQ